MCTIQDDFIFRVCRQKTQVWPFKWKLLRILVVLSSFLPPFFLVEFYIYSRLLITWTLTNSNLTLTWTNFPFLSGHFPYNCTLDNLNLFQFPLKVGSPLCVMICMHVMLKIHKTEAWTNLTMPNPILTMMTKIRAKVLFTQDTSSAKIVRLGSAKEKIYACKITVTNPIHYIIINDYNNIALLHPRLSKTCRLNQDSTNCYVFSCSQSV